MRILNLELKSANKLKIAILALVSLFLFVFPVFVFSANEKNLYVDQNASGEQNGSSAHPFKTIKQAMEQADNNTEVIVKEGEYEENVTIEKGVRLIGDEEGRTTIKAEHHERPVVTMKDNTKIERFTVKDGNDGIHVENDARTSIIRCVIKDNSSDGIDIDESRVADSKLVDIYKSRIHDNGRAGIYSGKKRLTIVDSEVENNQSDGIDIEGGSNVWISGTSIKLNGGSGMKLRVDGSSIFTKDNDVRDNKRDGVAVFFSGATGRINIQKTKLVDNAGFGIAKLQSTNSNLWTTTLTFDGLVNEFWGNRSGDISNPIFLR